LLQVSGVPMATFGLVLHASRCSNNCVFCGTKEFGRIDENVAADVRRLHAALESGEEITGVEISGNDPAEYPALPELVASVRELVTAAPIKLASHGKAFADESFVDKLLEAGVTEFVIPIYGHTSAVHDAVTRTPGSFVQTIRGLKNVVRSGANFSIT